MLNNLEIERVKGKKQRKKGVEPETQGIAVWGAGGRRFPSVSHRVYFLCHPAMLLSPQTTQRVVA